MAVASGQAGQAIWLFMNIVIYAHITTPIFTVSVNSYLGAAKLVLSEPHQRLN